MSDQEHSTLTGTSLHENKGVDTAAIDTVATAAGGVTVWKKLTTDNVSATIDAFSTALLHVRHEVSNGTAGGAAAATTWNIRPLQTIKTNQISGASLASNTVSLPAGTYFVEAQSVASQVNGHRIRLRNTTDGTTTVLGINCYAGNNITSVATLAQQFTIGGTKSFQLQHYTTVLSSSGLGVAGTLGDNEVYADLRIWKLS